MKTYRHITARKLTPKEEAFIDLLERQRRRRGFVRVFVNDPRGELVSVICEYVSWWQRKRDARDALVFTAMKSSRLPIPRVFQASARSYSKHQGKPLCIGQVVLFGADAYCPSVPLWHSYFDRMFALGCGYLNLKGSILIVHGNIARRRGRRTAFARKFEEIRGNDFYAVADMEATYGATASLWSGGVTPPNGIPCGRSEARGLRSIGTLRPIRFFPYLPRGAPVAA